MTSRYPAGPKDFFLGATFARRLRNDPLQFITELGRTYGDIAYFRLGPIRAYVLNHPQLIRELLVTKHKSFRRPPWLVRPLSKIDGQGLVLSEGELWQRQRRLVQPAFGSKRFEPYAHTIVEYTRRTVDRWVGHASLDIADEMTRLTLELISKILFDVDVSEETARLGEAVRVISQTYVREAGNPLQLPDWLPLAAKRRKRWAIQTIDQMIRGIIARRRASCEDHGDLLSMLLLAVDEEGDSRGMSDEQARDEAVTLFNAGHDSTAAALAWIWYAVASHPGVEAKLVEEIDSVLTGRPAEFGDVARLPYTEMVVKEALRLYPPTWALFPREAIADVEIGDVSIGRGSWVYAFPYVTQRDPRFFEDPEKFDPERFGPGRIDKIAPYAYFPFGGGPRVCVASSFAMMEMVLIVATVLQTFRLRLASDQHEAEPEPLIAIRPKGGLRVTLSRRAELAHAGKP